MNISFLQTFLTVIETGNLNKAAERLHVTQSTVTTRLDALEEALGQPLLIRSRSGTRLTRAGFELRPHAEVLVNRWAQVRKAVSLPEGFSGLFSFACEYDVWHDAGKKWLYGARANHTDLAIEARHGRRAEITAWLGSGITDAAMTQEPLPGPGLISKEFTQQKIVKVSSLPEADGEQPPAVYVDLGIDFRRQHSQAFPDTQTAGITFSTSAWALEHLLEHGGSAYLPLTLCQPWLDSGELLRVADVLEFSRPLYLVWREVNQENFPWLLDVHQPDK